MEAFFLPTLYTIKELVVKAFTSQRSQVEGEARDWSVRGYLPISVRGKNRVCQKSDVFSKEDNHTGPLQNNTPANLDS